MPWLIPRFINPESKLIMGIHALVIETPNKKMIEAVYKRQDKARTDELNTGFMDDSVRPILKSGAQF